MQQDRANHSGQRRAACRGVSEEPPVEDAQSCGHRQRSVPWRCSEQVPGVRYARLRATSPTYGAVTLIVVSEPREEQFYVMCLDTAISGPRLIRAWKRRHWIEYCFRTLKHLLATGACQVQSEDAYYGHLVLRLMGCLVLFYTSRVIAKGRLTMEEIIFTFHRITW